MTPEQFWSAALPWARWAAARTGLQVSVVLAQWADETAYGGYDWAVAHNPGNVGSFDGRPVAVFPTLGAGVLAYASNMNSAYYTAVRQAVGWRAQCLALGASPWASGHYGSPPGVDLVNIVQDYNLHGRFDPALPAPKKGEDMALTAIMVLENGNPVVKVYAVGAGDRSGHLLEFTRKPDDVTANSVIDITDGIGTADPYTVAP